MNAVEFTAELSSGEWLHVPAEAASQLPKAGKFKVIILPRLIPSMPSGGTPPTSNSCVTTPQRTQCTTLLFDVVFGEIHLFRMPATDGLRGKVRPTLVLFDLEMDAIICRVTSILRTGPLDVHLLDWSQAGLLNPSAARLDRVVTVEKSLLIKKRGYLTPSDLEGVRSTWNLMMKL